MESGFDSYAEKYDSWFMENRNVLYSEAALVAYFLKSGEKILSFGSMKSSKHSPLSFLRLSPLNADSTTHNTMNFDIFQEGIED